MRHTIITLGLIVAALAVTFGLGAMLEQTAFRAGPEPGIGLPAGSPMPAGTPMPADRHGRSLQRPHEA
ncbi:MAG: hypothetical protein JSS04_27110 [Proteobacteria bacterium]|nr:hypothetical protein [Pseudomonadota bacterium]